MAEEEKFPVFMDVEICSPPHERMVFELLYDSAPFTAENFRALCTGEKGTSPKTGKILQYKHCYFHRLKKGSSYVKGGGFCWETGKGGESIYGPCFPVESNELKHDQEGLLSMCRRDQKASGSHFIVTLKADPRLDSSHVVFGKLVEGLDTLRTIQELIYYTPIKICRSGVLYHARDRPVDVKPCLSSALSFQGRALVELNRANYRRPSSSKPKEVYKPILPEKRLTDFSFKLMIFFVSTIWQVKKGLPQRQSFAKPSSPDQRSIADFSFNLAMSFWSHHFDLDVILVPPVTYSYSFEVNEYPFLR
ncbi:peptidyl-prolyl cis-trans isomerase D-like [Neltuma alba]|uniref:peptidyl-prolyl cis-trans isomerase D-like n=1 Tax=Neltuma alba TaxID=207710 RepID=UPI0010A47C8A|nr:peptidyl-prolyl cis-trans isomerase D-like [Prosopis alba]